MAFKSDNTSGICPEVLEKIIEVNHETADAYGGDGITQRVRKQFNDFFERQVSVYFVPTGTAANCLALASMAPAYGAVFCHESAHITTDETNAPELFTGGAKLITLSGFNGKLNPQNLEEPIQRLLAMRPHHPLPVALSVSQSTEWGTVYTLEELQAVIVSAKKYGLYVHMDGARFANAAATLNQSPAELSWRLGVDVLSFGGTKNGALAAEAVVFFNPDLTRNIDYQQKRFGQLFSKMRFFSCQFEALFENDLWLKNAAHANKMAQLLLKKLNDLATADLVYPVEANEIFINMPVTIAEKLRQQGLQFYDWSFDGKDIKTYRFVTSFNTAPSLIDNISL